MKQNRRTVALQKAISDRSYNWRTQILTASNFDPNRDLHRDWQGLYQLYDGGSVRSMKWRDELRRYFRSLNEDLP